MKDCDLAEAYLLSLRDRGDEPAIEIWQALEAARQYSEGRLSLQDLVNYQTAAWNCDYGLHSGVVCHLRNKPMEERAWSAWATSNEINSRKVA